MATKSTKSAPAKRAVAKKTTVSKAAAKKPVAKKTVAAPVATHDCGCHAGHACGKNCGCGAHCACGKDCKCGANCACGKNCKCGANCACGAKCPCMRRGGFGRFVKKLLVLAIVFVLGFVTAKMVSEHRPNFKKAFGGPRVHFVNGCLDKESVKCPKLAEALPAMDINGDGCITREEYRAVKKRMRREIRDMKVKEQVVETAPTVEEVATVETEVQE